MKRAHVVIAVGSLGLLAAGCDSSASSGSDAPPPDLARTCVAPAADRAGTDTLVDGLGTATVEVADTGPCTREYTLSSNAQRRDNLPAGPRVVPEVASAPTLRTGHDLFDALYALALAEVTENSVDAISDWSFANGAPQACPVGGCFETGRLWKYVWTRDTAYSVDLGLALLDPTRARNSLEYKLSAPRGGGPEQIVQDTGTGGSYPVSTDRVVWALGAGTLLQHLDDDARQAFSARSFAALRETVEHDRLVVFDADDGLYTGEQSFLDWREQSYPAWVKGDVAPIASSKALSTNIAHLRALELASTLANEHADSDARDRYATWATALRDRIRERFWIDDAGLFATFTTTHLDPAPARQYDLLGSSLAVLHDVATPEQAARVLASYPHLGPGAAPVIFPQQQLTPIYHNRAEWPFVTAYWLRAAAKAAHGEAAATAMRSLMRGAALNLSNMENLEIASGAPWVDDGAYSGPVVNSQRQLWSVAGYVSMIHHTLFGLHFADDGLHVSPFVPAVLAQTLFGKTDSLALNDVPWRGKRFTVVLHLPDDPGDAGHLEVDSLRLNGRVVDGALAHADLDATNRIDVELVASTQPEPTALTHRDPSNWRVIFAPRVPAVTSISAGSGSSLALSLSPSGEDTATIRFSVYRDGQRIATNVLGTATQYVDTAPGAAASPCYAVETCFTETGNCSQRSRPVCWWGSSNERVTSIPASSFVATGGSATTQHGRFHYEAWGDAGHTLVIPAVQPTRTGPHLVQLVYGNGAGGTDTGITCAVKRVRIEDTANNTVVATGHVVMPHLGTWSQWADSTFVRANLDASRTYRVTIDSAPTSRNMSAFSHFTQYVGTGGASGAFERVNIAELKLLAR